MEEFLIIDGITYTLEVQPTECRCVDCEDSRSTGDPMYDSYVHLGTMWIAYDCGSFSEEEAFAHAEGMCRMFHRGELGGRAEEIFSANAIQHVRQRQMN